jgi:hypothetical protein
MRLRLAVFMPIALIVIIAACSAAPRNRSLEEYEPLIRAGFVIREADTPRKLEIVKSLPQKTIVPFAYKGRQLYVYAMESCGCAYVGEEENYLRLTNPVREDRQDKRPRYSISSRRFLLTPGIDDDQVSFILGR